VGQSPSGETTTWVGVTSRHSSKAPCARFGVFSHRTFCSGTGRRTGGALCPPCAFLVTNIHPWLGPSYGRCLVPALGLARADTLSHSQSGRHKARPLQGLLTTNVLARNEPLYGRCLVPALGLARADTLSHSQSGRHKARPLQGLLATNVLARNEPSYGRCLVPALGLSRHEHPSVARAVVRAVPCARPRPFSSRTSIRGQGRRTGGALCPPWAFLVTNIHPWPGPSYGRCLVPARGLARADSYKVFSLFKPPEPTAAAWSWGRAR